MRQALGTLKTAVQMVLNSQAIASSSSIIEQQTLNVKRELGKHDFLSDEIDPSDISASFVERMFSQKPTSLDSYLGSHSLMATLFSLLNDDWCQKELQIIKDLPESCKAVLYSIMLIYFKLISQQRIKISNLVYLQINKIYDFIKLAQNPYIKGFSEMYDCCQILQDYGLVKECLSTPSPKLARLKLQLELKDLEHYFDQIQFLFSGC